MTDPYRKEVNAASSRLGGLLTRKDGYTRAELIERTQDLNAARLARFLHEMEISDPDCLSAAQRADFSLQLVAPNA